MKTPTSTGFSKSAFTLLEMSIVLMVLLALISVGLFSSRKMDEFKLARQATEQLRTVYSAQRMLLADRPTLAVGSVTATSDPVNGIIPYLAGGLAAVPTVKSLTGATLTIIVNQSPPVINAGSGVTYDPSGPSNDPKTFKDGLWDVGE